MATVRFGSALKLLRTLLVDRRRNATVDPLAPPLVDCDLSVKTFIDESSTSRRKE